MEEIKFEEKEYNIANDWKFISIVHFVNVFKNVLAVESISTFELEFSLKYPECEPLCLNILLKLLMKKALFKPNSKIFENFEFSKLQEMLLKKINYFYKSYIRYLKRLYELADNNKIYEVIKKDVMEFKQKLDKFSLTSSNLEEKDYDDLDLKTSMIIEFFRNLSGRNPFLKNNLHVDNMDKYLNMDDDNRENLNNLDENANISNQIDTYSQDYLTFNDLSLKDKIEILFFFCNYALTFSGRAPLFKEELLKEPNEPPQFTQDKFSRIRPIGKDQELNSYYIVFINRDCRVYRETANYGLEVIVKNYEELEKFISKYEASKNPNEITMIKNIKDNLLKFKENDEEEKKREANLIRKQQAFEKAKKIAGKSINNEKNINSDFYLMNISDHMITRHQLNQITKTTSLNNFQNVIQIQKQPPSMSEQEKLKIKIEKERLARQQRLEKRQKMMEMNQFDEIPEEVSDKDEQEFFTRNKRNRSIKHSQRRIKKSRKSNMSSEDEYLSGSFSMERSSNLELGTDRDELGEFENEEKIYAEGERQSGNDIILEGNLIYRYLSNQIELEGNWFMSQDQVVKERLSYLLLKNNEYLECLVNCDDNDENSEEDSENFERKKSNFHSMKIKICSANLFECILINKAKIFKSVLEYLDSEYAGYFMYYGKTIEDRFNLSFELQDSLVKINGEGTNSLGNFSLLGYMNFYRNKDVLLEKNDLETDFIKLAEFKLTKIYTEFNPNENYRVIKSFQHRRKKYDDDLY